MVRPLSTRILNERLRRIEEIEADIGESDDPVGELLMWARETSPGVRAEAYRALADYWEDPRMIPFLLDALQNEADPQARGLACIGLGRFLDTASDEGAMEPDFEPDCYTADSLRDVRMARTVFDRVLGLARDTAAPLEVRRRAVEALGSFGYRHEVAELIEALYRDEREQAQVSAIFAMGRSGLKRYRKRLLRHLEDERPPVQFEAIQAVEWWEMRAALPQLRRIVLCEENPNRGEALAAYAHYAPSAKLKTLLAEVRSLPPDPVLDEVMPEIEEDLLDDLELGTRDEDDDFSGLFDK